jgi:hypothetical protein
MWGGVIAAPVDLVSFSDTLTDAVSCIGQIVGKSQQNIVKQRNVCGVGAVCVPSALCCKKSGNHASAVRAHDCASILRAGAKNFSKFSGYFVGHGKISCNFVREGTWPSGYSWLA